MSTQEISAGFPTDGRLFEPPQENLDNRRPRYVTFLGSLVDAEIIRSRPWTKGGGIEITNPCLRYVKNFLRKGRITPVLLDKHDWQNYDIVKKTLDVEPTSAGYFGQSVPPGYVPPALPPASGNHHHGFGGVLHVGGPSPYGNLVAKAAFPGEQIYAITMGDENVTYSNIRRGVVELKTLLGHEYRPQDIDGAYVDPTIWQIQRTIFPDYPNMPVLLDDTERLLDAATEHTALRDITDEMMESLIQFRDYASATIEQVERSMRDSGGGDNKYFFRYTSMDLVLLEQLGRSRKDKELREAGGTDSDVKELLRRQSEVQTAWMQAQIEEKQALTALHKRQAEMLEPTAAFIIDDATMKAPPMPSTLTTTGAQAAEEGYSGYGGQSGYSGFSGEVTMAADEPIIAPAEAEEPPAPTTFACEECGATFATKSGVTMHKTRWCKKE